MALHGQMSGLPVGDVRILTPSSRFSGRARPGHEPAPPTATGVAGTVIAGYEIVGRSRHARELARTATAAPTASQTQPRYSGVFASSS